MLNSYALSCKVSISWDCLETAQINYQIGQIAYNKIKKHMCNNIYIIFTLYMLIFQVNKV